MNAADLNEQGKNIIFNTFIILHGNLIWHYYFSLGNSSDESQEISKSDDEDSEEEIDDEICDKFFDSSSSGND